MAYDSSGHFLSQSASLALHGQTCEATNPGAKYPFVCLTRGPVQLGPWIP